jgi:hypothetical protein
MEKKFIDFVIEHAKREFACSGFNQTKLNDSMIKFLEDAAEFTNNEPENMKKFVNILYLLIDQFPITPITENDFVEEIYKEGNNPPYKIMRCTRYFPLYKTEDGRYWDDRAIAFKYKDDSDSHIFYRYQSKNSSKQQVTLPYYPGQRFEYIDKD